MAENESTAETLRSQLAIKTDELEKLKEDSNPDAKAELSQTKETLQKLEEQISLQESEMKNIEVEKSALESKTADLEKANQKLTEDLDLLRKGSTFNLNYRFHRIFSNLESILPNFVFLCLPIFAVKFECLLRMTKMHYL